MCEEIVVSVKDCRSIVEEKARNIRLYGCNSTLLLLIQKCSPFPYLMCVTVNIS